MRKIKTILFGISLKKQFSKKSFLRGISLFMIVVYMNLIWSCGYYKVNTVTPTSQAAILEQIKNKDKYIILHQGEIVWHFKNIQVNENANEMNGVIEPVPSTHDYYKKAKKGGKANQYGNVKKFDNPVFEVHFYLTELSSGVDSKVTIPFSAIDKIEVYDRHGGATFFAVFGIALVAAATLAIIIISTKSSCPFVYTGDGDSFQFAGEMYGGAIYSSLERNDYMPLPGMTPANDKYHLKIANYLLERQYTNMANLIVVEHPAHSEVLLDKQGEIQTITSPQSPALAISSTSIDNTTQVTLKDSIAYLFSDSVQDGSDVRSLILSFKKPVDSKSGKLVLNAKNSFWLDYVYGKFNEQFGTYYNTFAEEQKNVSAKKLNQWSLEQNIPLSVFVETEKGWEFVDYFNSIGPLASRDLVMPIDLAKVRGEQVRIKLQSGFMFWEVDYAAMDFSKNIPVKTAHLTPTSAVDERGIDVTNLIAVSDDQYLIQPEIGNEVTVQYAAQPVQDGNTQTVFLHSKGYYEYIRDYKNWPNLIKLRSFEDKGTFTRFSREQYDLFSGTEDLFASVLTQRHEN